MKRLPLVVAAFAVACASANKSVTVHAVFVVPGAGLAPGAVYATIDNPTADADTLTAVEMEDGSAVMLHSDAMQSMPRVAVPSHGQMRLKPGGIHGMVAAVPKATRGDSLRVTFFFSKGGHVTARATVIDYAQVDSAVGRGARSP